MSEGKNNSHKDLVISINAKINGKLNFRKPLIDLANNVKADVIIKSESNRHEITLRKTVQDLSNANSVIDAMDELQTRLSNICALLLLFGKVQKDFFKNN